MYKTHPAYWPFLFCIDVIGYLFCWWPRLVKWKEPSSVLVIRLEHMGDVILTTPLFAALRRRFPHARIDVMVRPSAAAALQGNPNITNTILLEPPYFGGKGKWRAWLAMAKKRYDLVIEPHGDPRNILLAFWIGYYVIGFGSRGLGFLLNKKGKDEGHVIHKLLLLGKSVGATGYAKTTWHAFDDTIAKTLPKKFIVFAPETTKAEKEWSEKKWQTLASMIKGSIVLTGQKTKMHIPRSRNVVGKTTPAQLASILKKASIVVSVDSATAHIAKAVGTPLVTLFGPEDPKQWGYEDEQSIVVKNKNMNMTCNQVGRAVQKLLE